MPKEDKNTSIQKEVVNTALKASKNTWEERLAKFGKEYPKPGKNAKMLADVLEAKKLPKIDVNDAEQVERRIDDYFNYCLEHDRKPSMLGVANWVGVSRMTINNWKRGAFRSEGRHGEIIENVLNLLEEMSVDELLEGTVYTPNLIFLMKNMFGYRDVQDVVVTPNNPMGDIQDEAELQKRIEESVIIDVDEEDG